MADAQLATLTGPESTPSPTSDVLSSMTEQQRQTWKMTGELPAPATTEEPPPPDTAKEPEPERTEEVPEPKPASEASTQEKPLEKISGAEKRIKQLLGRIKELEAKIPAPEAPKVEAAPATTAAKPQDATDPEPTPDKFETYEQFVKAQARWEARQEYKAQQEASAKKQQEAEQAMRFGEAEKAWRKRVAEATKRHPDFVEVALSKEFTESIPKGSVLDGFLLESEQGAEVMYHLASDDEEFARVVSLPPFAQVRELVKIESQFTPVAAPSPVPKTTSAPAPPTVLAAKGTPPLDEAQAALQRGDFTGYRRSVNARELASRKG